MGNEAVGQWAMRRDGVKRERGQNENGDGDGDVDEEVDGEVDGNGNRQANVQVKAVARSATFSCRDSRHLTKVGKRRRNCGGGMVSRRLEGNGAAESIKIR